MSNFALTNASTTNGTQQAISTTFKSLLECAGATSAPRRGKIYDILIGTNGTPADNYMTWDVSRITTTSTGSTTTANVLDPADAAILAQTVVNSTTEPTVTADSALFSVGVNQRASYRWVAAPGSELVWPATSCAGFTLRALSGGYTGTATAEIMAQEQ